MGKALAVQSARYRFAPTGLYAGVNGYHTKAEKAKFHTAANKKAQTVDIGVVPKDSG
jgi:hypothetical protein